MPYNDQTEYPRAFVKVTALTNTAQPLFAAGTGAKISHVVISNPDTATATVIFRAIDDSPEIMRVTLLAGTSITLPRGWMVDSEGVEVITAAAITATGLEVTAFYFTV